RVTRGGVPIGSRDEGGRALRLEPPLIGRGRVGCCKVVAALRFRVPPPPPELVTAVGGEQSTGGERQRHTETLTHRDRDTERQGHRETETHRDTHTQRDRDTHTERQRHTHTETGTQRERDTHTHRVRDTHTQRDRDTHTHRDRDTHTERQGHRERDTHTHTHRESETLTHRETERDTHTHTDTHTETLTQRDRDTHPYRASAMAMLMEHQFKQLPADRQIDTKSFLDSVSHLPPFFDCLGSTVFSPIKSDVNGNISKIKAVYESNPVKYKTLQLILEGEKEQHSTEWPMVGATLALMWLKRGLKFIQVLLQSIADGERDEANPNLIRVNAKKAYELALKKYHGFLVKNLFQVGICSSCLPFQIAFLGGNNLPKSLEFLYKLITIRHHIKCQDYYYIQS
uniref:Glycolipid transfer protein a n=1 Tax=Callorhinchus milii TaxID=7868 RepID=A0A4W3JXH0_CALMI